MRKGETIQGYRILDDFRVVGGMSKVTFAEKDGKEYFIKEFLSPKYPTDDSPGSEKIKAKKRKDCEIFENHHKKINNLIASRVALGGNLVFAVAFFREGTTYYKVNEKVDTSSLSLKDISELPFEKIVTICRSVCNSIGILHDLQIVHGDLKPDNVLIKETVGDTYVGKLIDFDDSYFSQEPPSDKEYVVGTPEYYSPELAAYIMDEDDEIDGKTLTLASDIFSLGIIFCEYFTGEKPVTEGARPIWSAVKNGCSITFSKELRADVETLLRSMLSLNADERPSIKKINQMLRDIKEGKSKKAENHRAALRGKGLGNLRGKGLNILDK